MTGGPFDTFHSRSQQQTRIMGRPSSFSPLILRAHRHSLSLCLMSVTPFEGDLLDRPNFTLMLLSLTDCTEIDLLAIA